LEIFRSAGELTHKRDCLWSYKKFYYFGVRPFGITRFLKKLKNKNLQNFFMTKTHEPLAEKTCLTCRQRKHLCFFHKID